MTINLDGKVNIFDLTIMYWWRILIIVYCIIIPCILFTIHPNVFAQTTSYPEENVNILEQDIRLYYNLMGYPYLSEITPIILTLNYGQHLYAWPTSWTWLCDKAENILNYRNPSSPLSFTTNDCRLVSKSNFLNSLNSQGNMVFNPAPP